jgi:hypothetical protein
MSIVNYPLNCARGLGNTGQPSCAISIEKLEGLLMTTDGFKIPAASLTSFDTAFAYLQAATLAANPLQRIYPLHTIEGLTNNTAAPEKKLSGYGNTQSVTEQPQQFEVEIENNGIEYYKKLRTWNGRKDVRVYWIDKTFIGGYLDSNGDLLPMEASVFFKQVMPGNVADITKYMCELELKSPTALTDDLSAISIPEGFKVKNEIHGLRDVTLAGTGGVLSASVTAVMSISKENFATKFASELTDDAWLVDGAATSPSVIDANGVAAFVLTAGSHTIKLNTPSALAGWVIGSLTSGGYESNEITVTVTAT